MLQTSSDLQQLVLTSLVNDSSLFGNVIDDLTESFFSNSNFQFIYKSLYKYYKQYHKSPTQEEMKVLVSQQHVPTLAPLTDILMDLDSVYRGKITNPQFVIQSVETFIKRAKLEGLLVETAQKYESDKTFTIDSILDDFLKAYNYQVTDVDCMRLDDFDKYSKLRHEIFGDIDASKIIKSSVPTLNQKLTYKGYKPTDLITVVAAPGVGKTTFLINEGLAASVQGKNVLHMYLGDMNEITAANRYMACLTGFPINTFSMDPNSYYNIIKNDPRITNLGIFNRIFNVSYAPGEVSADKLRAIVVKLQSKYDVHFDLIIIDYADNLAQEHEQMYQNGGEIYNKLKALAVTNRSVVITASQPQRAYYSSEIIPFEGIAESSKKLHVVDISLTMGKPARAANIAKMHLAKVREGETGSVICLKLEPSTSKIMETTEAEYARLASDFAMPDQVTKNIKRDSRDE